MRLRIRTLFRIVIVLVVALIVTVIAILTTIDPNDYRDVAEDGASDILGRRVLIAGDMTLSVSLNPVVSLEDVRIANREGGSRPDMATIGRLDAEVELWPLLTGTVRVTRLVVSDADVLLETTEDGVPNWRLAERSDADDQPAPNTEGDGIPFIRQVVVTNSVVSYSRPDGATSRLSLSTASLAADDPEGPVQLALDGALDDRPLSAEATVGPLAALLSGFSDWPVDVSASLGDAVLGAEGVLGSLPGLAGTELGLSLELPSSDAIEPFVHGAPDLPPISLSTEFQFDNRTVTLSQITAGIGETSVTGGLSIGLDDGRPRVDGAVAIDQIVLADAGASGGPPDDGTGGDDATLPWDRLGLADLDFALVIDRLVVGHRRVDDIDAQIVVADGRLAATIEQAMFADGTLSGTLGLDGVAQPPTATIAAAVGGMDLGRLLAEEGVTDEISGAVSVDTELAGAGTNLEEMIASVDGRLEVTLGRGAVANRYLDVVGRNPVSALLPLIERTQATTINCGVARFAVSDGVMTSEALLVDTPRITVSGQGAINLVTEQMDFLLRPASRDADLLPLIAPVRVYGPIAAPSIALQTEAVAQDLVTGLLLGAINPVGLLVPFVALGEDDTNPCVTALVNPTPVPSSSLPQQLLDGATNGLQNTVEGLGDGLDEGLDDAAEGLRRGLDDAVRGLDSLFGN